MRGLRRSRVATQLVHTGQAVTLREETWHVTIGDRRKLVGLSYRRPVSIRVEERSPVRIVDHLMIVRAAAALVTGVSIGALILRSVTRGDNVR